MRSRRTLLNNAKLYLILDRQVNSYEELHHIAQAAIQAGTHIVQLRDKAGPAEDILRFSKYILKLTQNRIPYIINDRADLAKIALASGVHLGQEDIPVVEARKMMGPRALIGASCQTLTQAQQAQRDGADYIGFGSVFKTLTKPERNPMDVNLLVKVINTVKIPVFPIGGIGLDNLKQLTAMGIHRAAVCRAVCQAKDIERTVKQFLEAIH